MFLRSLVSLTLLGSAVLGPALAHNINLGAHSRECFHEQLHRDDKMTVTFQVGDREFGGSGNLEIDFWVHLPQSCYGPYTILGFLIDRLVNSQDHAPLQQ